MKAHDRAILWALLAGFDEELARQLGQFKHVGCYAMRLVSGGAWIGCRVAFEPTREPETGELLDRSPFWQALVHDELDDEAGPQPTRRCMLVWARGRPIEESEYRYLIRDVDWHSRRGYYGHREPINLRALPPILPARRP